MFRVALASFTFVFIWVLMRFFSFEGHKHTPSLWPFFLPSPLLFSVAVSPFLSPVSSPHRHCIYTIINLLYFSLHITKKFLIFISFSILAPTFVFLSFFLSPYRPIFFIFTLRVLLELSFFLVFLLSSFYFRLNQNFIFVFFLGIE